ncbi:SDR family NAD(P)-dependent oxidoreductase [Amycolatopsis taiwanensis]|uniref:3-oxoacyl-ACP reductase n=1 Tax=Amycolatopsis taiwanensis TaxID=342230 RepID=A0A9W6R6Y6_9PSEU|nr:SDR family NAD(P)-dependent oxidoreductase [Amycolatopsis taiwanensis]GLY70214.1 3-oxoacyl-ACP reductase [Amycolatopsis taiwanensis]
MDLQLTGKRILVTGSNSGLGEAMVNLLAAEGAAVIVHGRDEARAKAVADAITTAGGKAEVVLGDLTTDAGADAVAEAALAGGPVDVLVNNAGAYEHVSWMASTPQDWRETYEGNVISGVRMIQRLVPQMRGRGWGRVITIGGGLAIQPMNTHPQYNATLAARHNLAVSLARELSGTGVTSNVVSPGAIVVDAVKDLLMHIGPDRGWGTEWSEIEEAAAKELVPNDTGRMGRPDEIATAVAYLASPLSGYISGATLRVDGGFIRKVN